MNEKNFEQIKKIGFGTKNSRDPKVITELLKYAQENNYDYIDCAWRYGNEAAIGMAVKNLENKNFSFQIPIQSKIWYSQFKGGINKSLKTCLAKLGIKQIDSYMLHRPHYNLRSTISAWKQLVDCKRMNLVKSIGVSNFDKELIDVLEKATSYRPDFNQIELSINNMRWDRIKYCQEKNIRIQAYEPLGHIEKNLKNPVIIKIAEKYEATVSQILLSFLINLNIEPIINTLDVSEINEFIKSKNIIILKKDMDLLKKINTYENLISESIEIDLDEIERDNLAEINKESTRSR